MRRFLSIRSYEKGIDVFDYPGWEKVTTHSVEEGIEVARTYRPEVIALVVDDEDLAGVVTRLLTAAPGAGLLIVTDLTLTEEQRRAVFDAGTIILYEAGWRSRRAELTLEEALELGIAIIESVALVAAARRRSLPDS